MDLIHFVVVGATFGLVGGMVPGPLTALVIGQTLRFNRREGFKTCAAPLITDGPLLAIGLTLSVHLDGIRTLTGLLSAVGACVLIWIAMDTWRAGTNASELNLINTETERAPGSLKKAILTNLFNPHPYVFWLTVGGPVARDALTAGTVHVALFAGAFGCTLVGSKCVLVWLVDRYKRAFQGRLYTSTLRLLALGLVAIAIQFMNDALSIAWPV